MTTTPPLKKGEKYIRVKAHFKKKPRGGLIGSLVDSLIGEKRVFIKGYTRKINQKGK